MVFSVRGRNNNTIGSLFKQYNSRNKSKQNKMIVFGLVALLVLGLAIFYFVSVRNQEGFEEDPFAGLDMTSKKEVDGMDKDTNVVVIFHKMQGCGHCKTFVPTWKKLSAACNKINNGEKVSEKYSKLSQKAKSTKKQIVCKCVDMMDDLSDDVSGFPEIRIYKETDYVSFDGNRENMSDLCEFIVKNM